MHTIHHGDCLAVLRTLPSCSVDAVVTDPPAGIAFMGKAWDGDRGGRDQWVAWLAERLAECLRVLKPGGHAVVWALPRTSGWTHRALEDAGFEVRDCITHLFGSGFPKSLDVGKAIDRVAGAERETVGATVYGDGHVQRSSESMGYGGCDPAVDRRLLTAPATLEAQQWDGWGTALKPAAEFWYLARKPFAGTVAGNVVEHGTGALNVEACRVGLDGEKPPKGSGVSLTRTSTENYYRGRDVPNVTPVTGRWPANVALTHNADCNGECSPGCAVAELDEQSGISRSGVGVEGYSRPAPRSEGVVFGAALSCGDSQRRSVIHHGDTGGASRFFATFRYQAKPSTAEKSAGLDHLEARDRERRDDYRLVANATAASGVNAALPRKNTHPTVKPVELMRWLVRLVTPPGGTVLDCFAGSGTTLVAAILEGFDCIGIEEDGAFLPIIEGRVAWAETQCVQQELFGA